MQISLSSAINKNAQMGSSRSSKLWEKLKKKTWGSSVTPVTLVVGQISNFWELLVSFGNKGPINFANWYVIATAIAVLLRHFFQLNQKGKFAAIELCVFLFYFFSITWELDLAKFDPLIRRSISFGVELCFQ